MVYRMRALPLRSKASLKPNGLWMVSRFRWKGHSFCTSRRHSFSSKSAGLTTPQTLCPSMARCPCRTIDIHGSCRITTLRGHACKTGFSETTRELCLDCAQPFRRDDLFKIASPHRGRSHDGRFCDRYPATSGNPVRSSTSELTTNNHTSTTFSPRFCGRKCDFSPILTRRNSPKP